MTVETPLVQSRELPLAILNRPELDARIDRDEEQLDELANDIRRRGLIYPLIVVPVGDRYEIVDGFTRFVCAQRIGLAAVPCRIYPTKDAAIEGVKYAANIYRLDMSPADEAVMFHELLHHECGDDIERLAAMTGKKIPYIDNRLALLSGDEQVFQAVREKHITIGVAQELNKCTDPKYRAYYLEHAIRGGATVAVVSAWIIEWKNLFGGPQAPAPPVEPSAPGIATEQEHPFTCIVCRKHDNVHLIRQVNVHQHCQMAILDELLKTYRGET